MNKKDILWENEIKANKMMVIPVAISSRYYSKKFTITIIIASFFIFLTSSLLGVYYGPIDLNNIQLPEGTVIYMGEETWLSDVIEEGYVEYDKKQALINAFLYDFVLNFLQASIIYVGSIVMAMQGKKVLEQQKEMTEVETKVASELELAAKIQMSRLPNDFSIFSKRSEVDLFASMTPAKAVGGDFYDFDFLDDDHLYMAVADVSGKGIPSAMFMMLSKGILRNNAYAGKSPDEILTETNITLCSNNVEQMFVTVWLGILEISTGILLTANAGHERPAVMMPLWMHRCKLWKRNDHILLQGSF